MQGSPSLKVQGPLEAHAQGFLDELMRLGYSLVSARSHLRLGADLGRWLEARRVSLRELTEARAAAFLRERRRMGQAPLFTRRGLGPLLGFLRQAGAVPPATADGSPGALLLTEYTEYLVSEHGLAVSTVHAYTDFARRFIAAERPRLDWRSMTPENVTRFVLRTARRVTPPTSKFFVTCLRALLRFLHVRGMTALNLSLGVPAVAGWRLSGVPKAIDAAQVDRVLSSFDGSPVGLRGAAIVRLLVRLGLRAGEVAALDLEDIDWRAAERSLDTTAIYAKVDLAALSAVVHRWPGGAR